MCLHPNSIPNPNYGVVSAGTLYKNTWNTEIQIPCGHCAECIALKQMEYGQRILMESKGNHMFMLTLTYKDDMIPRYATSTGHSFKYADKNDFVNMCKRIYTWKQRGENYQDIPNFRYFGVSELGGKKARPHIHIIIIVKKKEAPTYIDILNLEKKLYWAFRNEWQRNISSSTKKPKYKPLFEYHETWTKDGLKRNYDLHYINPSTTENGIQDAAFYVLKYLLKYQEDDEKNNGQDLQRQRALKMNMTYEIEGEKYVDSEYYEIWSKIKSKAFYSKNFGLDPTEYEYETPFGDIEKEVLPNVEIKNHIRKCIDISIKHKLEYPVFYNPINGNTFPLCKYYRDKFMTPQDCEEFFQPEITDDREKWVKNERKMKGKRIKDQVLKTTQFENFINDFEQW